MSARASRLAACRVYRCQLMAVPFAVRYPANVRSCKHGGRLPGVSLKKTDSLNQTVCLIAMEACGEELPICPLFYFSLEIR